MSKGISDSPCSNTGAIRRLRACLDGLGTGFKLAGLIACLLLLSLGAVISFSGNLQEKQAEEEMLEKARLLSAQMNASWEFVEKNESLIDTDADGSFNFKGIFCAIAGKSIAAHFTRDTDCVIRYIGEKPRKKKAMPDEFEQDAFDAFDHGSDEFYAVSEFDGEGSFRYVTPLFVGESCLRCHGEPEGEIDITGYPKEGFVEGDIAGAISIALPIDSYMEGIRGNIVKQAVLVGLVILVVGIILYVALSYLVVRPLSRLETTANRIEEGDFDVSSAGLRGSHEIRDLAAQIDSMALRLKESYENLESRVEERTKQLSDANEELERQQLELGRVNRMLKEESAYKSEFLAIMSHELRTPLTSILAFTEMWEDSSDDATPKEREAMGEIKENSQQLLQMVNNILEAARSEARGTPLRLECVDMVDLFDAVEHAVGFIADKHGIALETQVASDVPIFKGDWDKLRRIVENLVSNGMKYVDRGGHVWVDSSFDKDANEVVISVADDGMGIREEDLGLIFEKFAQAERSPRKRNQGSGLGLTVVRDLARAHGGSVEVRSAWQEGSEFIVRIPVVECDDGVWKLAIESA